MIVAIGSSIAARDRVRRRYCEASGEDAELASLLAALAERFGFAEFTREPRGGRGMRSWRHAPADLIERSGGASGREALALSTIGRLVYRDGRLAPAPTTGVVEEPTPPQRSGTMSGVADAWPECLAAERRIDRCDGDVARTGASAHPLTDAGAKS